MRASGEARQGFEGAVRFGASAACLLDEADSAPSGRDCASLLSFSWDRNALSPPKLGVQLISRAVTPFSQTAVFSLQSRSDLRCCQSAT